MAGQFGQNGKHPIKVRTQEKRMLQTEVNHNILISIKMLSH